MVTLRRRGFNLGDVDIKVDDSVDLGLWDQGCAVFLGGVCLESLEKYEKDMLQTEKLVKAVFEENDCDSVLASSPYLERLEPKFQSLGSVFNENDEQEIEMVTFDVMDGDDIIAEDLWMKASWLSFCDDDASLRFRFSFGIDLEEDVAADWQRQQLSSELTDLVFPESDIITKNQKLRQILQDITKGDVDFVERIIYFNAPNGGAYMHHDMERGHAGVVFAQLSGSTFWLALPKHILMSEIIEFSKHHPWPESLNQQMKDEMDHLVNNIDILSTELDSFKNDTLIHLMNETKSFVQFLISRGHGKHLNPGDVLLLPQERYDNCCWHSVFCVGAEMGQALSFAIRKKS